MPPCICFVVVFRYCFVSVLLLVSPFLCCCFVCVLFLVSPFLLLLFCSCFIFGLHCCCLLLFCLCVIFGASFFVLQIKYKRYCLYKTWLICLRSIMLCYCVACCSYVHTYVCFCYYYLCVIMCFICVRVFIIISFSLFGEASKTIIKHI